MDLRTKILIGVGAAAGIAVVAGAALVFTKQTPPLSPTFDNSESTEATTSQKKKKKQKKKTARLVRRVGSPEEFNTVLTESGNDLVVIDCFTDWCEPCKTVSPAVEALAAKHPKAKFLKVNIEQLVEVADEHSITTVPTFMFVRQGVLLKKIPTSSIQVIEETVVHLLANPNAPQSPSLVPEAAEPPPPVYTFEAKPHTKADDAAFESALGKLLGRGGEHLYVAGSEELQAMVDKKNAKAMAIVGWQTWMGRHPSHEENEPKGKAMVEAAARAGDAYAKAIVLREGWGDQSGADLAAGNKALVALLDVEPENVFVISQLGQAYLAGKGVEKDYEKAVTLLKTGVDLGSLECLMHLGMMYISGLGIPEKEPTKGLTMFKEAAHGGFPMAMFYAGQMLMNKSGPEYNPKEGMELLERGAELREVHCNAQLGVIYYHGHEEVVKQDMEKSIEYLSKAEQANDPSAALMLASVYMNQRKGPENDRIAVRMLRKAVKAGMAEAAFSLAICLLRGKGTKVNEREGIQLLQAAAQAGEPQAIAVLKQLAEASQKAQQAGQA